MRVFIAYANVTGDAHQAKAIGLALRQEGHEVFDDTVEIAPSTGYHRRIRGQIKRSDLFVFLISPDSITKGCYTLSELEIAKRQWIDPSRHVLPVVVRDIGDETLDPYLAAVSTLVPNGNVAADVAATVARICGSDEETAITGALPARRLGRPGSVRNTATHS